MNPPPDQCPQCGADFAGGLCPQCLLLAGMEPTPTTSRTRWVPPSPEELEAQLTQYQVLELLGHGGMGAVYKGWQTSLERHVAIKVLPPGMTEEDAQFTERFKHEARLLARLSHPAIVSVHDYGETADGHCYIVMEFIEGTDVQRMMADQGRLPPEYALAIALNVCDALTYAHEHGIIHRDIKPANVMVDTQGRVRVADFGLAKATDSAATMLTGTNIAMGTPGYIAPETLIMGMGVDARADLYAVGVMLYAMLTGKVPQGRFEAASVRVPGVDPRFDDIVNRAMQDEREARYASAADLRADLSAILTVPEEAVAGPFARPASSAQQQKIQPAPASAERPRNPPVALIGLAAVAVCAIGLFLWKPWAQPGGGAPKVIASVPPTAPASGNNEAEHAKDRGDAAQPLKTAASAAVKKSAPPQVAATNSSTRNVAIPDGASSSPASKIASPPSSPPTITPTAAPTASSNQSPLPTPITDSLASAQPILVAQAPAAPQIQIPPPAPAADSPKPSTPLPSELAALDAQFQTLQAERVAAPFEADVAKLNTSYIGGLEREIAKEKSAGHLDAVLALEDEKTLIREKGSVPGLEDETASDKRTTDPLTTLRTIYREAHAKLEAQRAANLKTITDPLSVRLQTLETDFTKKDRIADAKVVREYRESLGSALGAGAAESETAQATARAAPARPIAPALGAGTLKDGFTNSLGMKFVKVPGTKVLFCIHTTRCKDYAAYATDVPGVNGDWKKQKRENIPISFDDDYPVVGVSWDDAQAFCAWLSKKEGRTYRLPTDREWSFAVGIGRDEVVTKDTTPEMLSRKSREYPWGSEWPPPKGAGNFADTSSKAKFPSWEVIPGYTDGYETTSPVMSFKPNKLGLYDMSGNVWEWCEDWYSVKKIERVMRGGAWRVSAGNDLLSGSRRNTGQDHRYEDNGFRVVVAAEAPSTGLPPPRAPAPQPVAAPRTTSTTSISPTVGATALKDGFTNTLGMKFANVPGTKVLFCIHTTRVKDYAAYAAEVPGVDGLWKIQKRDGIPIGDQADHPVGCVSWDDANAFCAWLSRKEGHTYRLPTDREWSFAVGIGRDEQVTKDTTPEGLNKKISNVFPWGTAWPPPKGAGNFADASCKAKFPADKVIADYEDGFATTAPVMSFKANKLGLYDMGGNVYEWCEDWFGLAKTERLMRGGSWRTSLRSDLYSSTRWGFASDYRQHANGFRVVVASSSSP